jgi:hypothetical protein
MHAVSRGAEMTLAEVSTESVRRLAGLRLVTAAAGERVAPPWWGTQFLTDAGLRSMRRIFPRTALGSALACVTEAARADHGGRVGIGGRYHLFRLPPRVEQQLASSLSESAFATELEDAIKGGLNDVLSVLQGLATGAKLTQKDGPVSLGEIGQLLKPQSLADIAALYRGAAASGGRSYPYFVGPP